LAEPPVLVSRDASVVPGEAYLHDTPVLRPHAGTQPDLYLCWNAIPLDAAALDIVVHLHGFSRASAEMPLSEKVARAGLDLGGRSRSTLALLPRGNWLRYSWYDFPALLAGGIDRLVDYGLARFSATRARAPAIDRFILTAHSGGGMPTIDAIAGARRPPDEVFVFDGLYGRDPAGGNPMQGLEVVDGWLSERLAGEPARPGALRVVYIEQQTGLFSRQVQALIDRRLAAFDPVLAGAMRRRYRTERSGVPHRHIARTCHKALLADAGAELDWSG
jgi:hypothetical protein